MPAFIGGIDILKLTEGVINKLIEKKILTLPEAAIIVENAKQRGMPGGGMPIKQQKFIIKKQNIKPAVIPFARLSELRKKLEKEITKKQVEKVIEILKEFKIVEGYE